MNKSKTAYNASLAFIMMILLCTACRRNEKQNNKILQFSDIPSTPYYHDFYDFNTMRVLYVDQNTECCPYEGYTHATVINKEGKTLDIAQDNASRWHGGITFINPGDLVVVGSGEFYDSTYHHIVEDVTAEQKALKWLAQQRTPVEIPDSCHRCYVTGRHVFSYNDDKYVDIKCVAENGYVFIAEKTNPTYDDSFFSVNIGDEIIVRETEPIYKRSIVGNRDYVSAFKGQFVRKIEEQDLVFQKVKEQKTSSRWQFRKLLNSPITR